MIEERREVVFGVVRECNSRGGIADRAVLVLLRRGVFELQCFGQRSIVGGTPEVGQELEGPALRRAAFDALGALRIAIAARRAEVAMARAAARSRPEAPEVAGARVGAPNRAPNRFTVRWTLPAESIAVGPSLHGIGGQTVPVSVHRWAGRDWRVALTGSTLFVCESDPAVVAQNEGVLEDLAREMTALIWAAEYPVRRSSSTTMRSARTSGASTGVPRAPTRFVSTALQEEIDE